MGIVILVCYNRKKNHAAAIANARLGMAYPTALRRFGKNNTVEKIITRLENAFEFSAFLGNLAVTHQEELMLRIKRVLGKHAGNVQLFPICERDWAARQCLVIEAEPSAAVKEEQEDAG